MRALGLAVVSVVVLSSCTVKPYAGGPCVFAMAPEDRTGCREGLFCQPDGGCSAAPCTTDTSVPCRLASPQGDLFGEVSCVNGAFATCAETAATTCRKTLGLCAGAKRLFTDVPGCSATSYQAIDSGYLDDECSTANDGVDNNCNGAVDEVDPGDGGTVRCPLHVGACAGAYLHCHGGTACDDSDYLAVDAGYGPFDVCGDGIDNDCNGTVDDRIGPETVLATDVGEVVLAATDIDGGPSYRVAWTGAGVLRSLSLDERLQPMDGGGGVAGSIILGNISATGLAHPVLIHSQLQGGLEVAAWRETPSQLCVAATQSAASQAVPRTCYNISTIVDGPRLASLSDRVLMVWSELVGGMHFGTIVPHADGGATYPASGRCRDGGTGAVDCLAVSGGVDKLELVSPDMPAAWAAEVLSGLPGNVSTEQVWPLSACSCGLDTCMTEYCFKNFDSPPVVPDGGVLSLAISVWNRTQARTAVSATDAVGVAEFYLRPTEDGGGPFVRQVDPPVGAALLGPLSTTTPYSNTRAPGPPLGLAGVPWLAFQGGNKWYVQVANPTLGATGAVAVADAMVLPDGGLGRPALASTSNAPSTSGLVYAVPLADGGTELRGRVLCLPAPVP